MCQIVAMGGGGFSMEPENLALDQYVVSLTGKQTPAVCFLGQASGESPEYTLRSYAAFTALGCRPSHLSLFACPVADPADLLLAQDVIYVGGGNTRSMLALWQEWGLPAILQQACAQGTILAGLSAGANCWFAQGITDSVAADLSVLPGLGFLPGSFCPHYDGEAARQPAFHRLLAAGEVQTGYAADDGVAFHFVDRKLARLVSSRPKARGYRLERQDGVVVESALKPDLLENVLRS